MIIKNKIFVFSEIRFFVRIKEINDYPCYYCLL